MLKKQLKKIFELIKDPDQILTGIGIVKKNYKMALNNTGNIFQTCSRHSILHSIFTVLIDVKSDFDNETNY